MIYEGVARSLVQAMPSISTQTCWSWLRDLAEITRLAEVHDIGSSCLSCTGLGLEGKVDPANFCINGHLDGQETRTSTENPSKSSSKEKIFKSRKQVQECDDIVNEACLKEKSVFNGENDLTFPPIKALKKEEESSCVDTTLKDIHFPSIFNQLEQMDFSESAESDRDDSSNSDDEETTEEEEEEEEDTKRRSMKLDFPDLECSSDLSWPAILQYVRESETMAAEFFGLDNKESVERKMRETRAMLYQDEETLIPSSSRVMFPKIEHERKEAMSSLVEENSKSAMRGEEELADDHEDNVFICDFCGERVPRLSLLAEVENIEKPTEKDYICCKEYREYVILVAVCMRQMVETMRTRPPRMISVKPHTKVSIKKTMEQKAMAILRRKQKWEEIQRRKKMRAESLRHVKGTRTIQFTLESSGVVDKSWMVRPKSTKTQDSSHHRKRKRQVRKKGGKTEEKLEVFAAETLERLQETASPPGALDVRFHDDGRSLYLSLLSDATGYCRYPSGRLALVIVSPYKGVLTYLAYEDLDYPQLLAYADELGRTCCYFSNGSLRLLSTPHFLAQFDHDGHTRKKLKGVLNGGPGPASPRFQPISLALNLNKHITCKCNQENTTLVLSFPHDHIKFTISSKLKQDEEPSYSNQLQSDMQIMETNLAQTRTRIGQLLHLLQNVPQAQKLNKLESLYGPSTNRGTRLSHTWQPAKGDKEGSHKRTRSTGAINLKKNAPLNRHSKVLT